LFFLLNLWFVKAQRTYFELQTFISTSREIVEQMVEGYSQRIFAGQRPVFDGRKNMYSKDPLPIGRDKVFLHLNNFIALYQ